MADSDLAAGQDTQEGVDLEWIPESYRRDSLEESARVLLESQKAAQREMHEATTARRNLEQLVASQQAQIEQIQAQQTQQPEADPNEWYTAFEADPIATQKALAEQTYDQRFAKWQESQQQQAQVTQASNAEITASLAFKALEDQVGQLSDETRQEMAQIINARPHLIPQEAYYSPQKLQEAYTDVYKLTSTDKTPPGQSPEELRRTMKINAQTVNGAGGHLSTVDEQQQRWQEIQNAPSGTLGL